MKTNSNWLNISEDQRVLGVYREDCSTTATKAPENQNVA